VARLVWQLVCWIATMWRVATKLGAACGPMEKVYVEIHDGLHVEIHGLLMSYASCWQAPLWIINV